MTQTAAAPLAGGGRAGLYFLVADHQDTVRDVDGQESVWSNGPEYTVFGHIRDDDRPLAARMHGFTGRPWDADAGMYDYRARMYDPSSGRFATPDPAGLEDGDFNFYRYVGNGLQNATDPSGMFVKKLFRKVGKWFGRTLTRVFGEKAGRKIGGVLAFGAQVGLGLVLPGIGRAVGGAGRSAGGSSARGWPPERCAASG